MPVLQVKCCICGSQVNKSQTLSLGDGRRACRHHDGVESQAKQAQVDLKKKYQEGGKKPRVSLNSEGISSTLPYPVCLDCGVKGVTAEQFSVALQKELGVLPLSLQSVVLKHWQKTTDLALLMLIPQSAMEGKKISSKMEDFLATFGFVGLCLNCVRKHKVQIPVPIQESTSA